MNVTAIRSTDQPRRRRTRVVVEHKPSWAPNLRPLADEHRLQPVATGTRDPGLAAAIFRSMQRVHGAIVIDYDPTRQDKIERTLRHEGLL